MLELREEDDFLDSDEDDSLVRGGLEEAKNPLLFNNEFIKRAQNELCHVEPNIQVDRDGLEAEESDDIEMESLFGKVLGIERLMMVNKTDTLRDFIEKIVTVPENKLAYIEHQNGFINLKSIISLSDIFLYLGQKKA
eukprot:CAMPEP_0202958754 /NCGR_PEP_ID=MMETSP1396-20130829/3019_1 /ASSEMBLY_ACC=CAM_ASM_000872 /TAXON_ID= /ORGANISM="Pseudokeronopsis sp., Strain Brazil" /LENGTH=136 /DNA_ID=CAMNT_0049676969 /DNA_START=1103 /DNA_END=1513 /DNA_ORIENTATION=+